MRQQPRNLKFSSYAKTIAVHRAHSFEPIQFSATALWIVTILAAEPHSLLLFDACHLILRSILTFSRAVTRFLYFVRWIKSLIIVDIPIDKPKVWRYSRNILFNICSRLRCQDRDLHKLGNSCQDTEWSIGGRAGYFLRISQSQSSF